MTSFAFTYLRFTSDLVPTTVKVEMGLEITNMGTKSYVTSGGAGPAATTTAGAGDHGTARHGSSTSADRPVDTGTSDGPLRHQRPDDLGARTRTTGWSSS